MKTVFIVDDSNVNLVSANIALSDHYHIFTMPSASRMFQFLENVKPDLILLDISMPEMDGFEALKLLRSNEKYAGIPVVFLTSRNDMLTMPPGFDMDATDYILKPFSKPVLLNRINSVLNTQNMITEQAVNYK